MTNYKVKIKPFAEGIEAPVYATQGSFGLDLKAAIDEPKLLFIDETAIIGTKLSVELPDNLAMLILPRSGKALAGLQVANSPGLIDADYRGEVGIIVHNASGLIKTINPGDTIAQAIFVEVIKPEIEVSTELTETERGSNGFGSTGK